MVRCFSAPAFSAPRTLAPLLACLFCCDAAGNAADLRLLFMGDNGHHRPETRFQELSPALEARGIELKYTDRMEDLTADTLGQFDGLVLYANIDRIEDAQAKVVLDYVASGRGFIPLHCATYCWRNNKDIIALMGGQFKRHGQQIFTTQIAEDQHPIMKGYGSFTSWDETYIHHLHNEENRTVLEYRTEGDQDAGKKREPWTWVRTHGRGRVFYTAWGHDARTFSHPGFHNLVERGIRWACGDDPSKVPAYSDPNTFAVPQMTQLPKEAAPFEFVDVGPKIPNYTPGKKWGVQGKLRNMMQKPLPPEQSMKRFVTPEGMAVRLYADERNFQAKPIAMTWDERGRLWICETVDYPNELGGNRDRIRICEDTDHDGRADKFTVFADGLSIPTAIVIVRGGAVVQNGTETIYLKDTDGDDVSDQKTTLITGWTLGDTHGGVSNFRYGLDNWIWSMQGYNNSTPTVDGKKMQTFRMGFWRFKLSQTDPPTVTDLEFIRSSNNNTWGLGISEDGLIFGSTANHNPSMFVPIPNRYYESVKGWSPSTLGSIADTHMFDPITENVRQVDQFGGYTAGAGHALYTARTFPQQWWNKTAFVCGPTGHLVGTFVLRRDGAGYTSTSPTNLLASDDEWSAPIMAEVGPDGAVWVLDWYNYIVQHNPTPQGFERGRGNAYESDLRDKKHGRIYRVVPTSRPDQGRPIAGTSRTSAKGKMPSNDFNAEGDIVHEFSSLTETTNEQLVEVLKHPSFMWRLQAQRLLIEREAKDVVPALLKLLEDKTVDVAGLNVGAIHALHTLDGMGCFAAAERQAQLSGHALYVNAPVASSIIFTVLGQALEHPSAAVRRNTLTVLPQSKEGLNLLLGHQSLFTDNDAQVQLQAFLTLSDMPVGSGSAAPIFGVGPEAADPALIDAITAATAVHATTSLSRLTQIKEQSDGVVMTTTSDASRKMARRVAEHVARSRPDAATLTAVVNDLRRADVALRNSILDGLTAGLPANFEFTTTDAFDAALVRALREADSTSKSKLVRLGAQCGTETLDSFAEEIVTALLAVVGDNEASDQNRIAAVEDLVGFRPNDADIVSEVVGQLNAQTAPRLGAALLQAIQGSKSAAAGEGIVEAMPTLTPLLKSAAVGTLLSRPDWAKSLLAAIERRDIELSDLSLDQKQSLRSFPDKAIKEQAEKLLAMGGGLPDANRDKVLQALMHLCEQEGNVDAGREMFRKHCVKCHRHGKMGDKNIGPNLTGMAVHPKKELLTHIIDPSRSVEGNFRIYTVVDIDGRVKNGMLASETRTSITLIDTEAKETSIQREDIDELVASKKSVMPEGFEKQMTEIELSDLLEFLTSKGRYVPIPLDRYATAVSTKGLFSDNDNGPDRLVFSDWTPRMFGEIPFLLTDPMGKSKPNIILLYGPNAPLPASMPRSVTLPCNTAAKSIHILGGVGGWNYPSSRKKTASMIVRLHYADGTHEDHELLNAVHIADYIRRVDVPGSEFAFMLGGQQVRHVAVTPRKASRISTIELAKGSDRSAPIVMGVTIER